MGSAKLRISLVMEFLRAQLLEVAFCSYLASISHMYAELDCKT